jgi:hypothetical protein
MNHITLVKRDDRHPKQDQAAHTAPAGSARMKAVTVPSVLAIGNGGLLSSRKGMMTNNSAGNDT